MKLDHKFIGYDEGKQTLGTYDTKDPSWGWTITLENHPLARDLQRVGGNVVLVGFERGWHLFWCNWFRNLCYL